MNTLNNNIIPTEYESWRKQIEAIIKHAKLKAIQSVNSELLSLYWHIGQTILSKQQEEGWGSQVIMRLSDDLCRSFSGDRGYSVRNLKNMRRFAEAYPNFPILQVPVAKLKSLPIGQAALAQLENGENEFVQVPLAQIDWYLLVLYWIKVFVLNRTL